MELGYSKLPEDISSILIRECESMLMHEISSSVEEVEEEVKALGSHIVIDLDGLTESSTRFREAEIEIAKKRAAEKHSSNSSRIPYESENEISDTLPLPDIALIRIAIPVSGGEPEIISPELQPERLSPVAQIVIPDVSISISSPADEVTSTSALTGTSPMRPPTIVDGTVLPRAQASSFPQTLFNFKEIECMMNESSAHHNSGISCAVSELSGDFSRIAEEILSTYSLQVDNQVDGVLAEGIAIHETDSMVMGRIGESIANKMLKEQFSDKKYVVSWQNESGEYETL